MPRLPALLFLLLPTLAIAQDAKTVEQLAEEAKESIVVIQYTGRDGRQVGLGTGFVIAEDGLIATNFHVIGEGRPITVVLADGTKHEATAVHASDRTLDLAVVRIKAKKLKPLGLARSAKLKKGQPIVTLGHPRGLEHSVVAGVLSGTRDVEGVSMLQVAIPIEQGNSGGPVLDLQGRVVGVVTMKSLVTANLGFAVPVDALKPLLARPNTVPMDHWLTLGALDEAEWKPAYGARWRQRAGRIISDGTGTGFGGRTLCLWQRPVPEMPFELAVAVKLDTEAGAAGLIFGGDARDRHYGFYPSGGKLRLTRFNGPDVFAWNILRELPSPAYRPGEWNTLKVRIAGDKITCYVNDQVVTELDEPDYAGTTVGLAKFRDTVAEFKRFQVGKQLGASGITAAARKALDQALTKLTPDKEASPADLQPLLKQPGDSMALLREKARDLERQAEGLRKLAQAVHHERCLAELADLFKGGEEKVDLLRAALLVARLDNEEVDVDAYRHEVDRLARLVADLLPKDAKPADKLAALNKFLFQERGFHGSRLEYYARANSYLNEVIDDREGLPITLSVLYMELARRLGLTVVGVPLPGHFVVRHEPPGGPAQLIDVYEGAKPLSRKEAEARVEKITGEPAADRHFEPATKRAIVARMLHNLLGVARGEKDKTAMLRYLDAILVVTPDAHEERWVRAIFRFQTGQRAGALADCEHLLREAPPEADLDRVRELQRLLQREAR